MSIDISKFNWKQLFNDSQGKTSLQLVCGGIGFLVGCAGLIIGGLRDHSETLMMHAESLLIMSVGVMGLQQLTKDKPLSETVIEKATEAQKP
ncbi:MAG: hypothetical protein V4687_15985 [Bacteroidota bacterium]